MPRLPIYILIDTSGSMHSGRIGFLKNGLRLLLSSLRQNPYLLDLVYLSIITYNTHAKEILPLTSIEEIVLPEFTCSGAGCLGAALECVAQTARRNYLTGGKRDKRPYLYIFTDGKPSDPFVYEAMIPIIKSLGFSIITVCTIELLDTDMETFQQLADVIIPLSIGDRHYFEQFSITPLTVHIDEPVTPLGVRWGI